ncbi:hypothetical protein BDV25DRAFT_99016 [Aspergillus avenaceus]|uniref:Uncharacterized protein n=1 Tax=Aspergillus avenaceus TaxID=36643 RepID=A0A5N6TDF3_ASPAV|nr:hypothetical protein BDV25DRAFT_99016 [Aspergillus avenaceus]
MAPFLGSLFFSGPQTADRINSYSELHHLTKSSTIHMIFICLRHNGDSCVTACIIALSQGPNINTEYPSSLLLACLIEFLFRKRATSDCLGSLLII